MQVYKILLESKKVLSNWVIPDITGLILGYNYKCTHDDCVSKSIYCDYYAQFELIGEPIQLKVLSNIGSVEYKPLPDDFDHKAFDNNGVVKDEYLHHLGGEVQKFGPFIGIYLKMLMKKVRTYNDML